MDRLDIRGLVLRRDSSASPQNDKQANSPGGVSDNSATSGFASGADFENFDKKMLYDNFLIV